MKIHQLDGSLSGYVGEKNRQRIQDDSKRPMFSTPFSLWRSAQNIDDIRTDMINKISLTMAGQQIFYAATIASDIQSIVASILSSGLTIGVLQLSRIHHHAFWKMVSKDAGGPKWRTIVGGMFIFRGTTDLLKMQFANIGLNEALFFAESILYHYILFHLIFTRDQLPEKPKEIVEAAQSVPGIRITI